MAISTKSPAVSSRIWPMARRRVASGVKSVSFERKSNIPCGLYPGDHKLVAAQRFLAYR